MPVVFVPLEEQHATDLYWMQKALDQAEEAFAATEVPVGCVFVTDVTLSRPPEGSDQPTSGKLLASARNRTNQLKNVRAISSGLMCSWLKLIF